MQNPLRSKVARFNGAVARKVWSGYGLKIPYISIKDCNAAKCGLVDSELIADSILMYGFSNTDTH